MNLIDLAAETPLERTPTKTAEMKAPIVTGKKIGSIRKLYPFTDEELEDYRLSGSDSKKLKIVCGTAESLDGERVTVKNKGNTITFSIPDMHRQKIKNLVPGIKITAIITADKCLDLKLGPFFGSMTWNLFHGDNKKSVTAFIVQ